VIWGGLGEGSEGEVRCLNKAAMSGHGEAEASVPQRGRSLQGAGGG
jgi:hypothetical protein